MGFPLVLQLMRRHKPSFLLLSPCPCESSNLGSCRGPFVGQFNPSRSSTPLLGLEGSWGCKGVGC